MTDVAPDWHRAFDDPIPLPDGRVLQTLHGAVHYVTALPQALQECVEWQTADGEGRLVQLMPRRPRS